MHHITEQGMKFRHKCQFHFPSPKGFQTNHKKNLFDIPKLYDTTQNTDKNSLQSHTRRFVSYMPYRALLKVAC